LGGHVPHRIYAYERQYFVDLMGIGHSKKGCKNFGGLACRKMGIALFGVEGIG